MPDVGALLRTQAEVLTALAGVPATLASLQRSVRRLADVVEQAQDTIALVQRLASRIDAVVAEVEAPVRALAPGLRNAALVLGDPVITTVPDTLRQVQADALPLLKTVVDTQAKVAGIAASTDRLMAVMDEAVRGLGAIPGAGRLSALAARRAAGPAKTS